MPSIGLQSFRIKVQQLYSYMSLKSFDVSTPEGRSKERYRLMGLNAGTSAINKIATLLTTLISVPLTINYLGVERYGLWMTISSIIAMFAFADLGMGSGLVNAISEAHAKNDQNKARKSISSTFFLLLGIATILMLMFFLVFSYIPWALIFNIKTELARQEAGPAVLILIICFAVNLPLGVVQRVQMGYQQSYISNLWQATGGLLGLIGVLFVIYLEAGLPWLVFAMAGAPVFVTVGNWAFYIGRTHPMLFPRWSSFEYGTSKKIIGVGSLFFMLQFFALIGNSSNNIIIAQFLGASEVANFSVVQKLFSIALVAQFFIFPLWPALGEALARNELSWARKALLRSQILTVCISAIVLLPLYVYGKEIISFWVGESLVPSNSLMLGFVAWVFLAGYGGNMSALLNNGESLKDQFRFYAFASIISLFLKIVFVMYWGIAGVIWGTVLGYGLFYALPAERLANRSLKIPSKVSIQTK